MIMENINIMAEKEGLLAVGVGLMSAGTALIVTDRFSGCALLLAGLGVILLRGYFKGNGRWRPE